MIEGIYIQNFRIFDSFRLVLNGDLNIVVGNNEAGKSTLLEAIALALTKRIAGKPIESELSSHLFNRACTETYLRALAAGQNPELPKIAIELFLADTPALAARTGPIPAGCAIKPETNPAPHHEAICKNGFAHMRLLCLLATGGLASEILR